MVECVATQDSMQQAATPSCQRCPALTPDTEYTVLVVGDSGPPRRMGTLTGVSAVEVRTATGGQLRFEAQTRVTRQGVDFVDLSVQLSAPGVVYYAIAPRFGQAQFFQSYLLGFEQSDLPPQRVVEAAAQTPAGLRRGGVVAADGIQVHDAGGVVSVRVRPRCSFEACKVPENSASALLSPATDYLITLVAMHDGGDNAGSPDFSGAMRRDRVCFRASLLVMSFVDDEPMDSKPNVARAMLPEHAAHALC